MFPLSATLSKMGDVLAAALSDARSIEESPQAYPSANSHQQATGLNSPAKEMYLFYPLPDYYTFLWRTTAVAVAVLVGVVAMIRLSKVGTMPE